MTAALLLDTHAFVWWTTGSIHMPSPTVQLIAEAADVRVSLVTLWEVVLKEGTAHPMIGTADAHQWFVEAIAATGFQVLGITAHHIGDVQHLPEHHRDPFDRLLVAQAGRERLTLVSRDRQLQMYTASVLWLETDDQPIHPV